jgi:hypothetical protein
MNKHDGDADRNRMKSFESWSSKELEHSTAYHNHFIEPVPPMYVTEYERAYCHPTEETSRSESIQCPNGTEDLVESKSDAWENCLKILHKICDKDSSYLFLENALKHRLLDSGIEEVYSFFKERSASKIGVDKIPPKLVTEFIHAIEKIKK